MPEGGIQCPDGRVRPRRRQPGRFGGTDSNGALEGSLREHGLVTPAASGDVMKDSPERLTTICA
jgi:hypothetical protein